MLEGVVTESPPTIHVESRSRRPQFREDPRQPKPSSEDIIALRQRGIVSSLLAPGGFRGMLETVFDTSHRRLPSLSRRQPIVQETIAVEAESDSDWSLVDEDAVELPSLTPEPVRHVQNSRTPQPRPRENTPQLEVEQLRGLFALSDMDRETIAVRFEGDFSMSKLNSSKEDIHRLETERLVSAILESLSLSMILKINIDICRRLSCPLGVPHPRAVVSCDTKRLPPKSATASAIHG